jgi:hypothetical protein
MKVFDTSHGLVIVKIELVLVVVGLDNVSEFVPTETMVVPALKPGPRTNIPTCGADPLNKVDKVGIVRFGFVRLEMPSMTVVVCDVALKLAE